MATRSSPLFLALPLTLLLCAFALPTGAAVEGDPLCVIIYEPSADFLQVTVRADLILTPEDRENLSAEVDTDGDGNLTEAEVRAYQNGSLRNFGPGDDLGDMMLYLDARRPAGLAVHRLLRNWTGPAEEAQKGVVTEVRGYTMSPEPGEHAHALEGGLYAKPAGVSRPPRPVIETVALRAPEGWVVWSVEKTDPPKNGTPTPPTQRYGYMPATHNERSVTLSQFDTLSYFRVLFAKEGTDPNKYPDSGERPGPAPGWLAGIGVLALVALTLARTRRR